MSEDELPEGWATSKIGQLVREPPRNGHSAKASANGKGVRTLTLSAVTYGDFSEKNTKITVADPAKVGELWLEPDDLLIERSNTPELVGTTRLYRGPRHFAIFPDLVIRVRLRKEVLPRFAELTLHSEQLRRFFTERAQGTAGSMPKIDQGAVLDAPLRLAPLSEQHRIVEQVESLLTQVNKAKSRLDRVKVIVKRFRQAVLAAACSGKLTEEWRDKQRDDSAAGLLLDIRETVRAQLRRQPPSEVLDEPDMELPNGWVAARLGELVTLVTSGSRGWAEFYAESGPLFIRAQNINTDRLVLTDIAHVSPPANSEGARTRVQKSDVLVTITGANVTKTAHVDIDLGEAYVSQHVGLVRLACEETGPWIYTWLISPLRGRKQLLDVAYGAGKPGLNLENLRDVEVALPPLSEQREIVRIVQRMFALADTIEARLTAASTRAEKLPQSILSKAFRGELVPTEAELARAEGRSFESAEELLHSVRTGKRANETNGTEGARKKQLVRRRPSSKSRRATS